MKYINSILDIIGNTLLLKLNNLGIKEGVNIFAKLEGENPGGSVKDRLGVYMIKDAEDKGILKKGYTMVEATVGNSSGAAIAAIKLAETVLAGNIVVILPDRGERDFSKNIYN